MHPVLPDNLASDTAFGASYFGLKTPLQLNSALCALKLTPIPNATLAEKECTSVIVRTFGPEDGKQVWSTASDSLSKLNDTQRADLAKAYYRRALARGVLKRDEDAENDLDHALTLQPSDAAVRKEKATVSARRAAKVKAQRAAYSKMFSS